MEVAFFRLKRLLNDGAPLSSGFRRRYGDEMRGARVELQKDGESFFFLPGANSNVRNGVSYK